MSSFCFRKEAWGGEGRKEVGDWNEWSSLSIFKDLWVHWYYRRPYQEVSYWVSLPKVLAPCHASWSRVGCCGGIWYVSGSRERITPPGMEDWEAYGLSSIQGLTVGADVEVWSNKKGLFWRFTIQSFHTTIQEETNETKRKIWKERKIEC